MDPLSILPLWLASAEDFSVVVDAAESVWPNIIRSLILVLVFLPAVLLLSRIAQQLALKRFSPQAGLIAGKMVLYLGVILMVATVMLQLGFRITAVLGAAGILTLAISFAAQTSLSNLISGLFILWEQPFKAGDMILVNGTRGAVISVDLLSVKIRSLDNLFIRVPNETIIRSEVTTITRFPIRRLDINLGVAYREDPGHVMRVIREVAESNPHCLDEPPPIVIFTNFGSSALEFLVGLWFEKSQLLNLRNSFMVDLKKRFDEEDIEIPFPHLTLYSGSETDPFPVEMKESVPWREKGRGSRRGPRS